jgi:hypothetical protein
MATGYAYQPTDPQAQLNWAEVGQNLTGIIEAENEKRNKQAAEINEQTRQFLKQAEEIPQGESTSIREWGLNYSGQLTEAVRLQQDLLKKGDISTTEFLTARQNLQDGTDQAFTLMQEYQDVYARKMERMKSMNPKERSQFLEVWNMQNAEGFANFNRSQLMPDPRTGKVVVGMKVRNPETGLMELSTDPNDRRSVSALRGQLLGEYDAYDIESKTAEWVEGNGKWTQIIRDMGTRTKSGVITTIMNPMEKLLTVDGSGKRVFDIDKARALGVPEQDLEAMNLYIQAEDDWITGQAANPLTVSSVLTENAGVASNGKEFTFTYSVDDAKANPEKILLDPQSNQPIFDKSVNPNGEEQEEVFRQYMRNAIRNKHNVTSEAKTVRDYAMNAPQPTSPQIKANQKKKEDEDYVQNVAKLYYGNDDEVLEAENYLRTFNPKIDSIDRRGDNLVITYNDGTNPETIQWRGADGTPLTQNSWVIGNANAFRPEDKKIGNINDIVAGAGIDASRAFNPDSYGFSASDSQSEEGLDEVFKREVIRNSNATPDMFVPNGREKTGPLLQNFIASTPGLSGLSVKTYGGMDDKVEVLDGENVVATFDLDMLDDLSGNEQKAMQADMLRTLVDLANNRATIEQKALVTKGKRKTSTITRKGRGRLKGNSNNSSAPRPNGGGAPRP